MGTKSRIVDSWAHAKKRLSRIIRNLSLDLRYQKRYIRGVKIVKTNVPGVKNDSPSDPFVLDSLFGEVQIGHDDVLVDIGCGRGRVINWWLSKWPDNKIIGIEIDPDIAGTTRKRLHNFPNVNIVNADATEFLPRDGTVFYLFNPFNIELIRKFAERLKILYGTNNPIRIIYYNCWEIGVFEADAFWQIKYIDIGKGYHKAAIITFRQPMLKTGYMD